MKSFHAYPHQPPPGKVGQLAHSGIRNNILACDVVDHDDTGWFDPIRHAFVPQCDCTVWIHGHTHWIAPGVNAPVQIWIFVNGKEVHGHDKANIAGQGTQSCETSRVLRLKAGDVVQIGFGQSSGYDYALTGSCADGENTVNFFEGVVLNEQGVT